MSVSLLPREFLEGKDYTPFISVPQAPSTEPTLPYEYGGAGVEKLLEPFRTFIFLPILRVLQHSTTCLTLELVRL